jgi:type VI protein secretion system component Hcp
MNDSGYTSSHPLDLPKIPRFAKEKNNQKTPSWMVSFDDIVSSNFYEKYNTYCPLDGYWAAEERPSRSLDDGVTRLGNPYVIIPTGTYTPILENKMIKGEVVDTITVVRLNKVGEDIVEVQQIIYKTCRILMVRNELDEVVICFKPMTVETIIHAHNQSNAQSKTISGKFSTVVYNSNSGICSWNTNKGVTKASPLSLPTIPTVVVDPDNPTQSKWIMSFTVGGKNTILNSDVQGYENYTLMHGFLDQISLYLVDPQKVTPSSLANSALSIENVCFIVPFGIYTTFLQDALRYGKLIDKVEIVLLTHIQDKVFPLQRFTYTNCKLEFLEQKFDDVYGCFRTHAREHIVYDIDIKAGSVKGNVASILTIKDD